VLFQLHIPEFNPVLLLESESGTEIAMQQADTRKRPSSHL
jgi:hypothetical protein